LDCATRLAPLLALVALAALLRLTSAVGSAAALSAQRGKIAYVNVGQADGVVIKLGSTIIVSDVAEHDVGGFVTDPTGVNGHFAFTTRYTKKGDPKRSLVYTWRGLVNGVTADFTVKSNVVSGLYFSGVNYPISGNFTGKASLAVTRSSDGTIVPGGMGNLTFSLRILTPTRRVSRTPSGSTSTTEARS
jgi:hypothetical protein